MVKSCVLFREKNITSFFQTDRTLSSIEPALDILRFGPSPIAHDLALIHTRYSIIDLTAGGHQPFVSADGSVVVIFNGEIYNYVELRKELVDLGVVFRMSSDTEVLTEGNRVWGDAIWSKLNGFWAVALYDCMTRTLALSRDRLGVAPLYYRETKEGVYFGSSICGLVDIEPETIEIDTDKVVGFTQTSLKDFDNSTYYHQVKSVPPAAVMTFECEA